MENKKKYFEIVLEGLNIIIKCYLVFIIGFLLYNYYVHPESLNVVSVRPPEGQTITYDEYGNTLLLPEWASKSSTIEECKPLATLMDIYNKYLKPFFYLFVLSSLLNIGYYIYNKSEEHKENETKP